jgi:triacylglycerol esterase/lipase EstA (alpha/beta hydrolase family)
MVFFSTFLLLIILSLIHRGTAFSQPIINQNSILLGTVNGDVINNQYISITKVLSHTTLVSVKQSDLNTEVKSLIIKNAVLNKNHNGDISIVITQPTVKGDINIEVALELFLDGRHVNITGDQIGSTIRVIIPKKFNWMELKIVNPLKIHIPLYYRGDLNFVLDIEGGEL